MAYCPEDGTLMACTATGISFAEYVCPTCKTIWQYDAEQGYYRVIPPEEQIAAPTTFIEIYEKALKEGEKRFGSDCPHIETKDGVCLKCLRKVGRR